MKPFLIRWLVTTLSVLLVSQIPWVGVHANSLGSLIMAGLLLGFLNAFLKPVLLLLSLPLILVTMGLFYFVVNAVTLYLVGGLVPGFSVEGFGSAIIGSILIGIFSWVWGLFFADKEVISMRVSQNPPRERTLPTEGDGNIKQAKGRVIE